MIHFSELCFLCLKSPIKGYGTAKAGFKEPGYKEQAGYKELFLVTGILLSKKAGFKELLKKADIGFKEQKFCTLMMLRIDFVLFVVEFVCF